MNDVYMCCVGMCLQDFERTGTLNPMHTFDASACACMVVNSLCNICACSKAASSVHLLSSHL